MKTDAKFYAIHVSPSEKELRAMGNSEQEQAEAMKHKDLINCSLQSPTNRIIRLLQYYEKQYYIRTEKIARARISIQ